MAQDNIIKFTELSVKLNEVLTKQMSVLGNAATNLKALNKAYGKLPSEYVKYMKDALDIQKQKAASDKELIALQRRKKARTSEEIVNQRALAQASDRNARATSSLVGAMANLNAKHQEAKKRLQDLIASQKASRSEIKKAQREYDALNRRVVSASNAVRQFNYNVGNYPTRAVAGLTNLLSAFGVVGGVYLFASAIKSAFNSIKDFDKANTDLAATMGKTRKEIVFLTKDAKRLGSITKFTATEVSQLQKEFAKFGFNEDEILNATEATLDLAAATGSDLATSAMVAAQTLRGFGLEASEMGRVADVMGFSFTKSALDLSNFTESMKFIAPIAKTAGVSIEFATGMLSKLADAGIKGSLAGTSLRRILTEMAKTGLPAAEAFDKVAKSGISVTDAMDDVGRTAQTALIVLSENKEMVKELTKQYEKSGGAIKKMADEQLKSLSGQITLLTSAWDGFIQSLNKGDGQLSKFFVKTVNFIKGAVEGLSRLNRTFDEGLDFEKEKTYNRVLKEQKDLYRDLGDSAERVAIERADRSRDEVDSISKEIKELKEKNKILKEEKTFLTGLRKSGSLILPGIVSRNNPEIKKNEEALSRLNIKLGIHQAVLKASEDVITQTDESQKELNNTLDETINTLEAGAGGGTKRSAIKALGFKSVEESKEEFQEYAKKVIKVLEDNFNVKVGEIKPITLPPLDTKDFEAGLTEVQILTDEFIKKLGFKSIEESPFSSLKTFFDGTFEDLMIGTTNFAEEFAVTFNAIGEVAKQTFSFISQLGQQNFEQDLNILQKRYENQLLFAGEGTAARERLEEKYEEKRAAIQKKQAEAQKKQALFSAGVTTAQSALAAYASQFIPGVPSSLIRAQIAAGIATAFGLAQVGFIAAQQIPEFKDGVRNFEGGHAIVGDGGVSEIIRTNKGVYATPSTDTLVNLPKGADVFKNHDEYYNSVMGEMGVLPSIPKINVVNNGIKAVEMDAILSRHFSNIQTNQTTIDKNGLRTYVKKQNSKTTSNNNRVTFKGFSV